MQLNQIPKDQLKPGDILLCSILERSFLQYLGNILAVIKHYRATGEFSLEGATDLIHWIIGVFDEYHYCHASFWNGEKVVESRIKSGLRANDISSYSEDLVDVYRYHKDGGWLGDPALPPDPLLRKAQELVDLRWPYGFDSAYLLAILCVSRWHRAEWTVRIRDLLVNHAPHGLEQSIDLLFRTYHTQIDAMIERLIAMALEVVRKYRDRKGYVCSQTVAIIYNEASDPEHPEGTYKIAKPSYADAGMPLAFAASRGPGDEGIEECEDMIRDLGLELEQMQAAPTRFMATDPSTVAASTSSYEEGQRALHEDTFYTPRDLAESGNTALAGRLVL